jgi:hypothetical protein
MTFSEPAETSMTVAQQITAKQVDPKQVDASWLAIDALSASMRAAATAGEWIKVMEMAAIRHQNLVDHFAAFPVGPENADYYRDKIGVMLASEQELQALTLDARKQVMSAALVSNQNHRAVGAYLNTATR